jgi:hypothetical protein
MHRYFYVTKQFVFSQCLLSLLLWIFLHFVCTWYMCVISSLFLCVCVIEVLYFCVVVLFVWVCVLGVLYFCALVLFVWVCVASCYMCIFMHLVYLLVWVCGRVSGCVWKFLSVFLYIRCFCVRMFVVFVCVCVYVWCFCLCMCLCLVFLCVPFFVGRGLLCGRKVNHRYKQSHSVVQSK